MRSFQTSFGYRSALALLSLILPNLRVVLCSPISRQDIVPLQQSNDVWASVVANVAPLMALVGDKNAKEYMRNASSWHRFVPLAAAPLGILSIVVSAIRLSGSGVLRRLVGRDSE